MIVGKTKTDVDKLWNAFYTGGITNPVSVIEQINYLLFCRRLDDIEQRNERMSARSKVSVRKIFDDKSQHLRWSKFRHLNADEMFDVMQKEVFPFIKSLALKTDGEISTFSKTLADAAFLIQKSSLLQAAVDLISGLDLDNADTAGDLYEYLLSKLHTSGINGQFRTPRHIIRMMVEMTEPQVGERICDPACGTGGFLFSSLQYILEKNTSPAVVLVDEDGHRHGFIGDLLSDEQRKKFNSDTFYGYDFDQTMLRVSAMNMWLHGIEDPAVRYADTLSKHFSEQNQYDVVLANPPFKGQLDYQDCSPSLLNETKTKKTELLFVLLILRILDLGGRAAVIVPDGVIFGTGQAQMSIRKLLVEDHQLEAVVSMPAGVFKPYAGVSTAILFFTKGGQTDNVWFYHMDHDGFTLDDKRQEEKDKSDIPDLLTCWRERHNTKFESTRQKRLSALQSEMAPLKAKAIGLQKELNELQYESALKEVSSDIETALTKKRQELAVLNDGIEILQNEFNQLSRQFWVSKKEIVSKKYDLSSNRYRRIEQPQPFYPEPKATMDKIKNLQRALNKELEHLELLIK